MGVNPEIEAEIWGSLGPAPRLKLFTLPKIGLNVYAKAELDLLPQDVAVQISQPQSGSTLDGRERITLNARVEGDPQLRLLAGIDFTLRDGRVEDACQLPGNNVARTTTSLSTSRDCPRICEFSRSRNPKAIPVIDHIEAALAADYPSVLEYLGPGSPQQRENRKFACGKTSNSFNPNLVRQWRSQGLECDEYPFASTKEGGRGLFPRDPSIRPVPEEANQSQGGILGPLRGCYRGLQAGDFIKVVVVP